MYKSICIRNFRGIGELNLENLRRINLFVGSNNIGKTTMLEAVWTLHLANNLTAPNHLATFRGMNFMPDELASLWRLLFRDMETDNSISIEGETHKGTKRSLQISLKKEASSTAVGPQPSAVGARVDLRFPTDTSTQPIETFEYEYRYDNEQHVVSSISFGLGQQNITVGGFVSVPMAIFLPSRLTTSSEELADRFTRVTDIGKLDLLVRSLRVFQPDLTSLSMGFSLPQRSPLIRGHVSMRNPIPLPMLGGGVVRLAEILLAILRADHGYVMIDEIENGIYYQNLQQSWQSIREASLATDTQVFATTHSLECVQAAVASFQNGSADQFRLYRLQRDDGKVKALEYDVATAAAALDMNLEVR